VIDVYKSGHMEETSQKISMKGNEIVIEASSGMTLKVGGNFITINSSGIAIKGTMVQINSAGSALSRDSATPVPVQAPTDAAIADNADPGDASPTYKNQPPASSAPTHNPSEKENKSKKSWIEIELVDDEDKPVPGEPYRITLPDGSTVAEGTLDEKGRAKINNIDPGTCKVTFPKLHKDAWKPK
jgi:uncharacterized protein (DUF2345 family)